MHICLTSIELFGFGTIGGFGRATRSIGSELARRGHRVTVIVPRRSPDAPDSFAVDGMEVHQYPTSQPWRASALFRACRADVFHSQDTSLGTYLAMRAVPDRPHLITFRDPMSTRDWRVEWRYAGRKWGGWLRYGLFVEFPTVRAAVRRAQGLYCAAGFLVEKAQAKYDLDEAPEFLPTPVAIPATVEKATRPTVCHVGRWQKRKRPEIFFELAARFPEVRFIAVGAEYDHDRDTDLRRRHAHLPNLEMPGVLDQFADDRLSRILGESWILVNTAAREGLPITFVEAAAHGCAILSACDPDGFASRFGYHASALDFEAGLHVLLKDDRWRALGQDARRHVADVFATERAIDRHIDVYRAAIEARR